MNATVLSLIVNHKAATFHETEIWQMLFPNLLAQSKKVFINKIH